VEFQAASAALDLLGERASGCGIAFAEKTKIHRPGFGGLQHAREIPSARRAGGGGGASGGTCASAHHRGEAARDGLVNLLRGNEMDVAIDAAATVTQGAQSRSFVFDGMGRMTSETTPEAGTVSYQYNSYDMMTQKTDARGVITNYTYDAINRKTQASYNVGTSGVTATPTVTYTYGTSAAQNNIGRMITMTDGLGSESYTYDILGQVTQLQKVVSGTTYPIAYAYNTTGTVTSLTYPSGRIVTSNYDSIGRLSSISTGGTNLVSSPTYNPLNGRTGFTYGNGVSAAIGFSANRGQLTSATYTKSGQTLFGVTYGYAQSAGNNGQIASVTDSVDSGRNASYTYDALGRLSTVGTTGSTNYPAWGLSFTYDRYGNRTNQTVTAGTGPANSVSVSSTTNRITTSGYGYDASGNMTNDGSNTLTYDAENRMLSSAGSLGSATYSYDGTGLRVVKTSSAATTIYIFDGSNVVAEYSSGSSVSSPAMEYVYMDGQLLTKIESGATNYYHADRLSTRLVTDSSGNTAAQQGHFPFGEAWYMNGSATKWQFTSYERDPESSNDYARFRYRINRVGRFSTGDPVRSLRTAEPQNFNRYSYVANDPINRKDPLGREAAYCGPPQSSRSMYDVDWVEPVFLGVPDDEFPNDDLAWLWCPHRPPPESQPKPCKITLDAEPAIDVDCSLKAKPVRINATVKGKDVGPRGYGGRVDTIRVTTSSSPSVFLSGPPTPGHGGDLTKWHQNIQADAKGYVDWTLSFRCKDMGGFELGPFTTEVTCTK
jgi:RHS repeat-associated protein